MNAYIGHPSQISGVEEVMLTKGKGAGMVLLQIRNGLGLELTLLPSRCMDIARLSLNAVNIGYFSPSGYVAPQYYDPNGTGFLKSFTAGFMTTCGISAVGSPCTDNGETLPLHGNIANTPCEQYYYTEDDDAITVTAVIRDAVLFGHSYEMTRIYAISKAKNEFTVRDSVKNIGNTTAPCMLLYHINIGYPMLSERARLCIPADSVKARDEYADGFIDACRVIEKPQKGFRECCYYYDVNADNGRAKVGIYNPDIGKSINIGYDKAAMPFFTEWKMMGENEYVLGLEPGNCTPDGRDVMRKNGSLVELEKGEKYDTEITFTLSEYRI